MSEPLTRPSSRPGRTRAPRWRSFVVFVTTTIVLGVYLFVTAPMPLDARPAETPTVPIRTVFAMLELENDAARALWTEEIVTRGTARGLAFGETWRDPGVEAGPLPALFLRETARNLERTPLRLGLFLGSQFPINTANQLAGAQTSRFDALVANAGAPQFFHDPATGLQTAMFADRAVADACVRCHNEHPDSPKRDWQPHSIMGATTWMYPEPAVTAERAVEMIGALRASIRAAYASYLAKVATFRAPPEIGERWPKDGPYLPSEDVFMRELARRTSAATLQGLLEPGFAEATAARDPGASPVRAPASPPAPPAEPHPMLVIRSAQPTRVTVEHAGIRLLVARIPAGGATALRSPPPLRLLLGKTEGVEVEYGGAPVALHAEAVNDDGDVELVVGASPGKS